MAAPAANKPVIAVVGATGNQGGSVARRFLDAGFHVRGLTRNPASPAAEALAAKGAEMVAADLEDVESLKKAFKDADYIFSVTQYWEPFFRPDCRAQAAEQGISCRRFAYDVELRQGKNIADAAASTAQTLAPNGFLVSTLSNARRCSGDKFTELYHFDSKAEVFPEYVDDKYPDLAAKMSCIHTGYFYTSFNILPNSYFHKRSDGSFQMRFTTDPDRLVPHLSPVDDMGSFVYAVSQMPAGKAYMAEGTTCSWSDWIKTWGAITGVPASYQQVSHDEQVTETGELDTGIEVAYMYSYASAPGYDGAMDLLTAADIKKVSTYRQVSAWHACTDSVFQAGIDCPMTTWEEWAKKQDWSAIINKEASS